MGDRLTEGIITILVGVVGLATVSVILSKNSQTGSILTSAGTAFSGILKAATAGGSNTLSVN